MSSLLDRVGAVLDDAGPVNAAHRRDVETLRKCLTSKKFVSVPASAYAHNDLIGRCLEVAPPADVTLWVADSAVCTSDWAVAQTVYWSDNGVHMQGAPVESGRLDVRSRLLQHHIVQSDAPHFYVSRWTKLDHSLRSCVARLQAQVGEFLRMKSDGAQSDLGVEWTAPIRCREGNLLLEVRGDVLDRITVKAAHAMINGRMDCAGFLRWLEPELERSPMFLLEANASDHNDPDDTFEAYRYLAMDMPAVTNLELRQVIDCLLADSLPLIPCELTGSVEPKLIAARTNIESVRPGAAPCPLLRSEILTTEEVYWLLSTVCPAQMWSASKTEMRSYLLQGQAAGKGWCTDLRMSDLATARQRAEVGAVDAFCNDRGAYDSGCIFVGGTLDAAFADVVGRICEVISSTASLMIDLPCPSWKEVIQRSGFGFLKPAVVRPLVSKVPVGQLSKSGAPQCARVVGGERKPRKARRTGRKIKTSEDEDSDYGETATSCANTRTRCSSREKRPVDRLGDFGKPLDAGRDEPTCPSADSLCCSFSGRRSWVLCW